MDKKLKKVLGKRKFGHRAIGVVYHPKFEQLCAKCDDGKV
jgi:hypothetical protein